MDSPQIALQQYGIDIGLLISGLFGSILLTSKGSAMNLGRTFSSLIGGAASANYITPVIISITKLENVHFQYSAAFLLGYLGLRGIDYFSSKILSDHFEEEKQYKKPITRTKRVKSNRYK